MRVRTYLGILGGVLAVVVASYLTYQNQAFLAEPFQLGGTWSVPLWVALLAALLVGLLPAATLLLLQSLRKDLSQREDRRRDRARVSLAGAVRRAIDFQADGQWDRAASELSVFLEEHPDDFAAQIRLGEVLRHLGRGDEALEVHRKATALYPRSVAVLYQLVEDYQARGEPEVAREIENRILRDHAGFGVEVLRRRRNAALGIRDWRRAAELQDELEVLSGGQAEAPASDESGVRMGLAYQRGVALLEDDRVEEAIEVFEQLLSTEERFIPAAIMLGEAELVREREGDALERWLAGYRQSGSPTFLQRIEDHFIENEQPRQAIETLRRLISESENALFPRFFLGRLYYRLEMHDEALKILAGLDERVESSPTYHFLLGRIHERRGELALALESFRACARQLGVPKAEYRCSVCGDVSREWNDRCEVCGSWNSIDLDFEEEQLSPDSLGVRPAAVWGTVAASLRTNGGEES